MHLQENTFFDLDFRLGSSSQDPLRNVAYAPTKFEFASSKGLGGDAFLSFLSFVTGSLIHEHYTRELVSFTRKYII